MINNLILHHHVKLGNFGTWQVYQIMKEIYQFSIIDRTIRGEFATCIICLKSKWPNKRMEGARSTILVDEVGELVTVDLYGAQPKGRGGVTYIFVVLEVFSKYIKLYR